MIDPDGAGATIPSTGQDSVLAPGETCWRIERADRYAVFVDAADYFAALKQAVLHARRRVLFLGWDFEPRIRLDPRTPGRARDDRLGRVLEAAVRATPDLEIGVLQWGMGMLESLRRGVLPVPLLRRATHERLRFAVDHHHPLGAAHHQKIVVVDDCFAFAGGIDVTADRWDTSDHADWHRHRHRHRPTSRRPTGPWHDVTSLVSGPAARALGELARERWESGTGRRLEPVEEVGPCWPDGVEPLLTDVDVAISRTRRLLGEHLGVEPAAVAAAVEASGGSLVRAVESLRTPDGRTLRPFEAPAQHVVDRALAATELLDAERTPDRWSWIRRTFTPRRSGPAR
ncbi:hypothetical protein [Blastococcus sp. SYSU DS0539]